VEDLDQLGSLLTDKCDILALHLMKYVSAAGEQAEKGLRNISRFCVMHFICTTGSFAFW